MHNEETGKSEEARAEDARAEDARVEDARHEQVRAEDTPPEDTQPQATEPEEQGAEEQKPEEQKTEEAKAEGPEAEAPEATEPHGIVGIRFEPCGKIYCFKSNGMGLKQGERVVVESDFGVSIGRVAVEDEVQRDTGKELKPVLRRVTEEDLNKEEDNKSLKEEAFDFCKERIMARGLAMKLLGTDVTLDRKRIVFFFSAEGRIDFRELVKDLAAKFRTRIELRQVGVRDAARITGGLGVCGRQLCCGRFLTSFLPISIKMAKKQELALNTSKLSGICGRLMCCLGYEYEEKLRELKKKKEARQAEKEKVERKESKEETTVEVPQAVPEPREAAPKEAAPSKEGAPAGEGEAPSRKKRRRRRRRPRRKPDAQRAEGQEQRPAQKEKPAQAQTAGDRPAGEKPAEGASPVKKPFRRKRRRRMKGKKKE